MPFRTISVVLSASNTSLRSVLRASSGEVVRFSSQTQASSRRAQVALHGVTTAADEAATASSRAARASKEHAAEGAALIGVLYGTYRATRALVGATVDFDQAMRNVNSITHLNEQAFARQEAQVVALSRVMPQTATTLAQGLYDIASSGFMGSRGLTVLKASAQAASAGMSTTATAAQAITGVLNAYGLSAQQASNVSDSLFQTVNVGVVTFDQLAQGIGQVIGTAASAHVDINQVGAAIATMTRNGVTADEAFTSTNRVLVSLIQPSQALQQVYAKLGYESGAAALQQKGLRGVMTDIHKVTGDNITAMLELFPDIRAARGALALMSNEGKTYAQASRQIENANNRQGATLRALREQQKSVAAQWRLLKNNVTADAIEIGLHVLPVLVGMLQGAQKLTREGIGELRDGAKRVTSFLHGMADAGVNVAHMLEAVWHDAEPVVHVLTQLGGTAVVETLNATGHALADVTGFLNSQHVAVEALAVLYASRYLPSVERVRVAMARGVFRDTAGQAERAAAATTALVASQAQVAASSAKAASMRAAEVQADTELWMAEERVAAAKAQVTAATDAQVAAAAELQAANDSIGRDPSMFLTERRVTVAKEADALASARLAAAQRELQSAQAASAAASEELAVAQQRTLVATQSATIASKELTVAQTEAQAASKTMIGSLRGGLANLRSSINLTRVGWMGLTVAALGAFDAMQNEKAKAQTWAQGVTQGFDALNLSKAQAQLAGVQQQMAGLMPTLTHYRGLIGTLRASAEVLDPFAPNTGAQAANQAKALVEQTRLMQIQTANVRDNLAELSTHTGLTYDQLLKVAAQANIDLSGFAKNAFDVATQRQVIAAVKNIEHTTHLSATHMIRDWGLNIDQVQQLADTVQKTGQAVAQAFAQQTDVVQMYQPDQTAKAVQSAQDRVQKATQRLADTEQRIAGHKKTSVSDTISLRNARRSLAAATDDLTKAEGDAAKGQLDATLTRSVSIARTFEQDITAAARRGLDPTVVAHLLEAGPQQAAPILQALVSDHSNRLIKMYNQSAATIRRISAQVVELNRLTQLAINAPTDRLSKDLPAAMRVATESMREGKGATPDAVAKALGLDPGTVKRVADEFGITLQRAVNTHKIMVPYDFVGPLTPNEHRASASSHTFRGFKAAGGLIYGPGGTRDDKAGLYALSRREFVQPAAAVDHYGVGFMEAVRSLSYPRGGVAYPGPARVGMQPTAVSSPQVVHRTVNHHTTITVERLEARDPRQFEQWADAKARENALRAVKG